MANKIPFTIGVGLLLLAGILLVVQNQPNNSIADDSLTPNPNSIYWIIDFETDDFSQLEGVGEVLSQQNGQHTIVETPVHSGQHAALLEIEEQGTDAAYLFFYKIDEDTPMPTTFFLSSWIYLPEDTCSGNWWNTFQFKSSADGDSSNSDPVHSLNIRHNIEDDCESPLEYQLFSKPPAIAAIHIQEDPMPIPLGQWFHVEVFYERSDTCGQMMVWQDGEEIFNLECTPTVYSSDTLYSSINNYAQDLSNLYYVDDIVLSAEQLGPVTIESTCMTYSGGDNLLSNIQSFFESLACGR